MGWGTDSFSQVLSLLVYQHNQEIAGIVRRRLALTILMLALVLTLGFVPSSLAQKSSKSSRKVISEVKPAYPLTLKNLHIEGLVRLTAIVLPNGSVAEVEVRGGNPILVENAVKAVKAWKYVPAPSQTEEDVTINFSER